MPSKLTEEQELIREAAVSMAIADGYDEQTLAARPGKFEGEPFYLPYFYGQVMDGDGEPLGSGDTTDLDLLTVTDDERAAFELKSDTAYVAVCYSEQGFVSLQELTDGEAEDLREQYAEPEPTGQPVKEYTFDVKLFATLHVKATCPDMARRMIKEHVTAADANFGAWPDGSPILAEASVDDEELPLIAIDGKPV